MTNDYKKEYDELMDKRTILYKSYDKKIRFRESKYIYNPFAPGNWFYINRLDKSFRNYIHEQFPSLKKRTMKRIVQIRGLGSIHIFYLSTRGIRITRKKNWCAIINLKHKKWIKCKKILDKALELFGTYQQFEYKHALIDLKKEEVME